MHEKAARTQNRSGIDSCGKLPSCCIFVHPIGVHLNDGKQILSAQREKLGWKELSFVTWSLLLPTIITMPSEMMFQF